ncbi:hypothetical protein BCF55_0135 [Hydrogenivirga caldilitoris]|uniref:Uncharacterized protein n=1 Tax=Hydrogenivirga caldilitoris TaxID=246264 RepID=A0A497XM60_9AQUI|nr:hypothetical protein [Hydrogenivirga caldilitoris]RLJ69878.1 hypothetical protein BCF55_0135 [Hydrogenivirga caldilitoris]
MKINAIVIDIEGTTSEITEKLNEVIDAVYEEGGEVLDVKVTHAREHGIDGFIVVYTIIYRSEREIPEE